MNCYTVTYISPYPKSDHLCNRLSGRVPNQTTPGRLQRCTPSAGSCCSDLGRWRRPSFAFLAAEKNWLVVSMGFPPAPKQHLVLINVGHISIYSNIIWLVVEPPLWKIWKTVGMMKFPIYGKYIINVPVTTNQLYSTLAVSRSNWNRVFLKLGMAIPWGRSFRCVSRLSAILDYIQIFRIQMT